jgi:hypothetical protein
VLWFADRQLGVAVVSNTGSFDSSGTANKVAGIFLEDSLEPEKKREDAQKVRQYLSLDASALDKYTGIYRLSGGPTIEIEKKDGKLQGAPPGQPKLELKAISPNRFYIEQVRAEAEFTRKDGKVTLKLTQGSGAMEGEQTPRQPLETSDLPQYVGTYWSDELEARYTLKLRDDKLVAEHIRHGEITLTPFTRDHFLGGQWFMQEVRFTRNSSGIKGMTLGGGRVKGVFFAKQ